MAIKKAEIRPVLHTTLVVEFEIRKSNYSTALIN